MASPTLINSQESSSVLRNPILSNLPSSFTSTTISSTVPYSLATHAAISEHDLHAEYISPAQEEAQEIRDIKIAVGIAGVFFGTIGLVLLGRLLFRRWRKRNDSKAAELAGESSMRSVKVIPREESTSPTTTQSADSAPSASSVLSKHPAPFASVESGAGVRDPENVIAPREPQQPHHRVRSFHRRRRLQDSLRRKLHRPVVPSSLRESPIDDRVVPE